MPVNKAFKPFHSDEPASGQRCDTVETPESQAPATVLHAGLSGADAGVDQSARDDREAMGWGLSWWVGMDKLISGIER